MKSCIGCKHCHHPRMFSWKEDWWFVLIPIVGWLMIIVLLIPQEPWCSVGQALIGVEETDGPSCAKMRTFGTCGMDAKLFEYEK